MRGFGRRAASEANAGWADDDPFESILDGAGGAEQGGARPAGPGRAGLDSMFDAFDDSQELLAASQRAMLQRELSSSSPTSSPPLKRPAFPAAAAASPSASMDLYNCIFGLVRAGRSPIAVRGKRKRAAHAGSGRCGASDDWPSIRARIVRLLDERGADPDHRAWQCEPLLYHALTLTVRDPDRALEIARILLDRGADALALATDGRSMLDVALDLSDGELVKELLNGGALPTARALDVFGAPVQQLLALARSHGFEAEASRALNTALADAVHEADVPLAGALLRHGACANARMDSRPGGAPACSVLHAALGARSPNLKLIALLLDNGAKPAPIDAKGNCALWTVVLRDDGEALALLLAAGAASACTVRDEAMGTSVRGYCFADSAPSCRAAFERFEKGDAQTSAPHEAEAPAALATFGVKRQAYKFEFRANEINM